MKEKKSKPKYNMWQCTRWMISLAWHEKERLILVLVLLQAFFAVATNLIYLYIAPAILSVVEEAINLGFTGEAAGSSATSVSGNVSGDVSTSAVGFIGIPGLSGQQSVMVQLVATIAIFTILIMICQMANAYMESFDYYSRISLRTTAILRDYMHKACTTSYPNHADPKFRALRAKCEEAIDYSELLSAENIWLTLRDLMADIAGFLIYAALISTLQVWLVLIIVVTALIGYFVNRRLNDYVRNHQDELTDLQNRVIYHHYSLAPNRAAAKDIRIFNMVPWITEVYQKSYDALHAFRCREHTRYFLGSVLNLVLAFLRDGVAYLYLITLVLQGNMSASEFLLYFNAVGGFSTWVTGIMDQLTVYHRQSLELSFVMEYLNYPEPFRFEDGEPIPKRADGQYEIRLEDVSFAYPGENDFSTNPEEEASACADIYEKEKAAVSEDTNTKNDATVVQKKNYVLEHINLTLHPGEKIAVVGVNGAGKTTLIKIISGLLDPSEGRVLINGQDIRKVNRRDYYELFTAVFQKFSILPASIAANIAQVEEGMDMHRVKQCVELAGLTEKIESLPDQYDSKLVREVYEDATELSGGEMQRLMLARALYKNAPIVLLDEPTAALDPLAEAEMYGKYQEMTKGRSSVYISHRLASTRFCDRILLLDGHVIAEEGTHDELLALGGKYAELFSVQAKYYN